MTRYNIGYVTGVFDLFHIGHLNLIRNAKNMCNHLIVGVLTDELAARFKNRKPYIPLEERMEIIESLKYVDNVVAINEDNIDKIDAWEMYRYDCLFSGDDWKDTPSWIEDKEKLVERGSDIYYFEYTKSTSSSRIKELINDDYKSNGIFIYGAGKYGLKALEFYGFKNVIGFIDRDEKKIGTLIEGKPVFDINKIKTEMKNHKIVIALREFEETEKMLGDYETEVFNMYRLPID